ncbi:MAG: radical SAM protein [Candidatus Aegiribacteria sp.]|nr:radical SAM protein [Candidatus Aegiribacteria sp.]
MQCPGADSLFLRANGNFVCWDDAGSDKILQQYDSDMDMSRILSDSGPCALISKKLAGNILPFSDTCPGCYCLSSRGSPCFNSHVLNVMQVEPSSRCTLECKACATPEERARLQLPHTLSSAVFQKVLQDFSRSGIDIRTFDFSGHGEPMMNPDLWQIVSMARKHYPRAFLSLITNAHGDFEENHAVSGLDQIQFSIDGVDQKSYEKYRVGGNFTKASSYMKSFTGAARSSGSSVRMIWRYILFNHNDSTDQLREAYEMASEFRVHELRFVFTHKGMWSTDLTSAEELRRSLISLGVPSCSIHMDSFKSLRKRQRLSHLLNRNQNLYSIARKLWRKAKRKPSLSTIVTSDFYQLYEPELQQTLDLGSKLLRKGRLRDARALFLHVNKMVQLPVTHNAAYDPEIIYRHLGHSYKRLKTALSNYPTGTAI